MLKRKLPLIAWLGMSLALTHVLSAAEPLNLSTAKAAVIRYVDSGDYAHDLKAVGDQARTWIEERVACKTEGERLVLILDVDETALSNLEHMRSMDFGYLPKAWDAWVAEDTAPAIKPVLKVFQTARRLGVTVFFITGRKESDRPGTERNLKAVGYGEHEQLICKPTGFKGNSGDYKTETRRKLEAEGWTIIANVGDQQSDLIGGFSERVFKLADPFYLID